MLKILKTNQLNFLNKLKTILDKRKFNQRNHSIEKKILSDVKIKGDKALIKFEKKFSKNQTNTKKNKIF